LGIGRTGRLVHGPFWTLALEEHFYLIWPMLLICREAEAGGKVAFLLRWRYSPGGCLKVIPVVCPGSSTANLLTRTDTMMDALLWGCLAAIYFPEIVRLQCAHSFLAALVSHPGDIAGGREASHPRVDRVARCADACVGAEHCTPAASLLGSLSRMATAALAGAPSPTAFTFGKCFSYRKLPKGAWSLSLPATSPWNLLAS